MKDLLDRYCGLSAADLNGEAKRVNVSRAGAEWELAACLCAMETDQRFRQLEYKSVILYAEAELGISARKSVELLRVGRMAGEYPQVSEAFYCGTVSYCKLREIVRVINAETAEQWMEYARTHSTREVERAVALSPRALRKMKSAAAE